MPSFSISVDPNAALPCGMRSRFSSEISLTRLRSMRDARVDELLPLLGRLVLGVLAQIAELARTLDLLRQLGLELPFQLGDFVLEAFQ